MTGRLKIIKVHDIDYYLSKAGGIADYYLTPASEGREPPGVWVGRGAADLGLRGIVDAAVMKKLFERQIGPDGKQMGNKRAVYRGNAGKTDELAKHIEMLIAKEAKEKGPYVTEERKEEITREEYAKVRNVVLAWDFTWSVAKSISLTHAGLIAGAAQHTAAGRADQAEAAQRQANLILDAVRETAREIIERFEATGLYTRTGGHHGAGGDGAWRDGKGVIGAAFLQHTNRDNDPHLHVHTVIANLVQRADGADEAWRTIYGRPLLRTRGQLDAIAKRRLASKLGKLGIPLVQRADDDGFEVGGVTQDQIDAYSSRRTAVEQGVWVNGGKQYKRLRGCGCPCDRGEFCGGCGHAACGWYLAPGMEALIEAYTDKHGRPPSRAKVWQLHEQAFRAGRPKKSDEDLSQAKLLEMWEQRAAKHQVRALASIPAAIALYAKDRAALRAPAPVPIGAEPGDVLRADGTVLGRAERHRSIRIAVAEVQRQNSTWFASDLMWEIQAALPALDPDADSTALMQLCLTEALGNEVEGVSVAWLGKYPDITDVAALGTRARDGQSIYRDPDPPRYCTLDHLDEEYYLLKAAGLKVRPKMTSDEAYDLLEGSGLSEEQTAAAAMLLSTDRPTVVFVGPPGTGKSYTLGVVANRYIAATGGRVIGLALAKNAVRVLQGEGIEESYTIADFLGMLKGGGRRGHIRVDAGDIMIVDESSQVPTAALVELQSIASEAGAWLVQAGDTEQLPSPEAGGIMRLIAKEHGHIQLREVLRFKEPWERLASLRLRQGDTSVIAEYKHHGRLQEGRRDDMEARAVRNWLADHLAGLDTLLLAGSNEEAGQLSRLARRQLIRLGEVRNSGDIVLDRDGNDASIGDLLRARQNTKIPAGGKPLENRDIIKLERWFTGGMHRQAIVRRQLPGGRWTKPFAVPEAYIASQTELAYAGNVDVSEGRTVDTAHELVTRSMNRARHLVGGTRGRQRNDSYIVTSEPAGRHIGGDRPAPELIREMYEGPVTGESVLESIMTREPDEPTAIEVLRESRDFPRSMPQLHKLWQIVTRESCFPGYDRAIRDRLSADEYARYLEEDQRGALHGQLRRAELAGVDVGALLDRVTARELTGADSIAAVIHGRIERLKLPRFGQTRSYAERTPHIWEPDRARIAQAAAEVMDAKATELGEQVARRPPVYLVRYLGLPPREPGPLRDDWVRRAGIAESYRALREMDDPIEAIGVLPPQGAAELREAWAAAAQALEMREEETDVRAASQGQLEALVRGYERVMEWAPEYVAGRLEETSVLALNTRAKARIAEVEANKSGLDRDRVRAELAAARADELEAKRLLLAEIHEARQEFVEHNAGTHARVNEAALELTRREKAQEKLKVKVYADGDPQPEPEPQPEAEPKVERTDEELADIARLARERIAYEREREEEAMEPWEREPWKDQYEQEITATWQPGRVDPQPEADGHEAETPG